jgi:hypothetical protein
LDEGDSCDLGFGMLRSSIEFRDAVTAKDDDNDDDNGLGVELSTSAFIMELMFVCVCAFLIFSMATLTMMSLIIFLLHNSCH